jgi:hypothetical protein
MSLLCQHLVSNGYWALVEYIGSRLLKCSETDLPTWHNPYVTCVHNMPHMDYHVTELRTLCWTSGIWWLDVSCTWHQEWLCPISTQYLEPQHFLQGSHSLWVKMHFISIRDTTFYVQDVPEIPTVECKDQKVVTGIMQLIQMHCDSCRFSFQCFHYTSTCSSVLCFYTQVT